MSYYNHKGEAISPNAYHALQAARLRKQIGRWATQRYLAKRNVPLRLYQLAIVLLADERYKMKQGDYRNVELLLN